MTRKDLEMKIILLTQEMATLRRFYNKWFPLVSALDIIVQDKIDENST